MFVPLAQFQFVRKYISKEGAGVKLSQLGSNQWQKTKERVNAKIEEIASRLVELYAHRNEEIGLPTRKMTRCKKNSIKPLNMKRPKIN